MATDQRTEWQPSGRRVPPIALLLSLLALSVPVLASAISPDWLPSEVETLIWLLAILPAFLLSYYRGWRGASLALAGFMAVLVIGQIVFNLQATGGGPPVEVLLVLVGVAIVVSLGSGFLSEAFRRSLTEAQESALTDVMTGLPNRRLALLQLERAFAAADRTHPLAVVIFDLDHLKSVNEQLGPDAGDELIRIFAGVLRQNTRAMDTGARFGGEEFLAILEGIGPDEARLFAERVREEYGDRDFKGLAPTVSAGIATFEEGMASPDVLIAAADHALYRAKQAGRNRILSSGEAPARRQPIRSEGTGEEESENDGERLVLIVDDQASARRTVSRALRSLGYGVLEATDGESAVKVLEGLDDSVDVLLTDIMMPGVSGFRLVEMVRSLAPDMAVVYMSGYAQRLPLWGGAPGSQNQVLQKPFGVQELKRTIETALAERGAAQEGQSDKGTGSGASRPADEILVMSTDPQAIMGHILAITERVSIHLRTEKATRDPLDCRELWRGRSVMVLHGDGLESGWFSPLKRDVEDGEGPRALLLIQTSVDTSNWITRGRSLVLPGSPDPEVLAEQVVGVHRAARGLLGTEEHIHSLESKVEARSAQLSEALSEALRRLAVAAEYRDDLTGQHAERVGILSGMLATRLGLSAEEVDLIEKTAPLHDIGKIAVPDSILHKPGTLTPAEREVMESHTEVGARMLQGRQPLFQAAASIARHHHERWDGTGYPDRLSGENIPIAARVVSVADVWDSLSNERPYRKALTREETMQMIDELTGNALDPSIVPLLQSIVETDEISRLEDLAPPETAPSVVADSSGPEEEPIR